MTVGEPTSLYIQWTSSLFVVFLAGFVTTLVVRFVSPNQHQDRGGGGGVFSLRVGVCHAFRCSRLLFSRVWKTLWNKNGDGNACSSLCSSLIPFGLFETERCLLFPKVGVWRTLCGLQTRISPSLAFHQQHLMSPSPTIFPPEDPSDTPKTPLSPSGSSCSKERTEPFQKSQREKKKKRRGPVANEQTGDSTSKQRDKDENSMCRENKNGPRTIPLVACASPPLFSASPPLLEWEKQEKDSPARPLPTRKRKGTADAKIVVTHGSSLRSRFESLWEKERRTRVQKWLRVARLTDTGEAEFQLGLLHGGKDVPSSLLDRETSFSWFLASANKGWKEAFLPTGLCLLQGRGTDVDEQQAFRWFLRGAERLGNVECCFWVGSCYLQGVGVDPNPVDGKQWVERAAKGEHVEAMKLLGQTYAKEASDLQEGISRSLVDSFLLGGDNRDGQQKNTTKSVPHPPSLCSFSFPFSFPSSSSSSSLPFPPGKIPRKPTEDGTCRLSGGAPPMPPGILRQREDKETTLAVLHPEAGPLGTEQRKTERERERDDDRKGNKAMWALLQQQQDVEAKWKQAFFWWNEAASFRDVSAKFCVAQCHEKGEGTPPHPSRAFQGYLECAQEGYCRAYSCVAWCFKEGFGTPSSIWEAIRWHEKAAKAGVRRSMLSLGRIFQEGQMPDLAPDRKKADHWFQKAMNCPKDNC